VIIDLKGLRRRPLSSMHLSSFSAWKIDGVLGHKRASEHPAHQVHFGPASRLYWARMPFALRPAADIGSDDSIFVSAQARNPAAT
jgi:hypothetical protein